jgi:hypothetical protein
MDPDVLNFGGVMIICLSCLWGVTVIWTRTRRDLHRQKQPEALKPGNFDERFAQLQQSVDAIAVEVERIAEGQRFSTKLLSEANRSNVYSDGR